jgi:predicted DNA-binding protein YlxM (UPF0122 family)
MKYEQLNDKQLQMIEELVKGEKSIVQICEMYDIPRSTYYEWKRNNKLFNNALREALELKDKVLKQNVKSSTEKYVRWLEKQAENGKNENAKVSALKELIEISGIKDIENDMGNRDESASKNKLLDMIRLKRKDGE